MHPIEYMFQYFLMRFCTCINSWPEKAMAPHSSTLAWKIQWMEEPGRLQSMGLLRVGHDSAISLSLFTFMHWRRRWQPTPVFLPGESQGRGILVGGRLWVPTELDTTEVTQQQQSILKKKESKKYDCQNRRARFHPRVGKTVHFICSVLSDWLFCCCCC